MTVTYNISLTFRMGRYVELYQHFRPEEKPFIDELLDWAEDVKERFIPRRSDFLDPREQHIARSVIGGDPDITWTFAGGSSHAERRRLLLAPPYDPPHEEDAGLVLFSVDYPKKFATLTHRDLLGALMSLGIKREKFGDLLFLNGQVQFVAAEEIAEFTRLNLTEVGNSPVTLREMPLADIFDVPESWQEQSVTVSSLRLDAVIATIYGQSRAKNVPLIRKGFVKVNWKVIEDPSYPVQSGDVLSVRGRGRSKLLNVEGKTKKGKYRMTVGRPNENPS